MIYLWGTLFMIWNAKTIRMMKNFYEKITWVYENKDYINHLELLDDYCKSDLESSFKYEK